METLITEMKNFLRTCEIYCNEEANLNEETKTFKTAIEFLNEKLLKMEEILKNQKKFLLYINLARVYFNAPFLINQTDDVNQSVFPYNYDGKWKDIVISGENR